MTLHVTVAGWLLGEPSGANRRLLALLAHLGQHLAHRERITVLHRPDFAPPTLPGITWRPIAIPAGPTWRRVLAERRELPAALRELGASVHDHGFLPLGRLPVPTCLLVHDVRAADGATARPRHLARLVLRRSCRRAQALIAPSAFTRARLAQLVPEAPPAIVVGNGVELPSAPPTPPTVRPLPPNGYLLHTGHLEPRKNVAVVVRALALVPPDQRPDLWLAGRDAGQLAGLRALALRLGLGAHVVPLGVVDDGELARLYAAARAVVVPSVYEGFGLPVLEAFAHGTAVLASNATALPEVAGGMATLLAADDPATWRQAIANLPIANRAVELDAAQRKRRRERAAIFTWDAAAGELMAVYRRLATGA